MFKQSQIIAIPANRHNVILRVIHEINVNIFTDKNTSLISITVVTN